MGGYRDSSAGFDSPTRPIYRLSKHSRLSVLYICLAVLTIAYTFRDELPKFRKTGWKVDPDENNLHLGKAFDWESIEPSKTLKYTTCFGDLKCARLDVPLNWNSTSKDDGPRAAIAIIKTPAKVPVTDERYGGAILMNPGGPSNSGIFQVLSGGKLVQTMIDSPIAPNAPRAHHSADKYYDIIGFDPRGVNNTTPRLKCFPDAFNEQAWMLQLNSREDVKTSSLNLPIDWARAKAMGASCSQEHGDSDMIRYVNTAQVVEDMVQILEMHGQWRENEAMRSLTAHMCRAPNELITRKNAIERTKWNRGQEKLNYWGFSYGTILGQTFAAMHPDRVHRLIIDGVVVPSDYYESRWLKNLQDADGEMMQFFRYCHEAGPERCPLYKDSAEAVEAHLLEIFENLRLDPIVVPASSTSGPEIVTVNDMYGILSEAMYEPMTRLETFFHSMALVEHGNGSLVAAMKQSGLSPAILTSDCHLAGPYSDACALGHYGTGQRLASSSIVCMDGQDLSNLTKQEFGEYVEQVSRQSKWRGSSWAAIRMSCIGFTTRPAWKFSGPISANTSHPILLLGNSFDPATPVRNTRESSKLFPGSVVLQQDSEGHCTYSSPSLCTVKAIRNYFQTGSLPEPGTICLPEARPFIGCVHKDMHGNCRKLDEEEQVLLKAMEDLAAVWPWP